MNVSYPCQNCLSIQLSDYNLHVIIVYRSPSSQPDENVALIYTMVSICFQSVSVLMGDFNLPSLRWDLPPLTAHYVTPTDNLFLDCFVTLGLTQWVQQLTYPRSSNVLDLFFTTDPDRVGCVQVLPPIPKCDHCPVIIDYIFQENPAANTLSSHINSHVIRQWERGKYGAMSRGLSLFDWDFEFASLDANACFERLCVIVYSLIRDLVPVKHPTVRARHGLHVPLVVSYARDPLVGITINPPDVYMEDVLSSRLRHYRSFSINADIHTFHIRSQAQYESSLIHRMKKNPKLFHAYIRHKKQVAHQLALSFYHLVS